MPVKNFRTCAIPNGSAEACIATGDYKKDFLTSTPVDFTTHQVLDINVWEFDVNLAKAIGYSLVSDFIGCAKHFDLTSSDCLWAIGSLVLPAALKAVAKGVYALRAAMVIGDIAGIDAGLNVLTQLSKDAVISSATFKRLRNMAELARFKNLPKIANECIRHSFPAGTGVLMADGSVEAVQDVRVGDTVRNARPGGATELHRVERTYVTTDDTEFTDLSVRTLTGESTLTSTQNHPYYDLTRHTFVDASRLAPGDRLQTVGLGLVTVVGVRNRVDRMVTYDLTIEGVHTYYVMAGTAPVLVHNVLQCPTDVALGLRDERADKWAEAKNITHYMGDAYRDSWIGYVRAAIDDNPDTVIHVYTEGFSGGFEESAARGLQPGAKATEQEMGWIARAIISKRKAWSKIKFYDHTGPIDVPQPDWKDPKFARAWALEDLEP
ncbi:Hint domain-containing protein [Streptomyces sp. MS06]|uniref:Hint domain-containing protein n=1 Tax=Streptomyces sp. MS06 TaxID=3385974 RepID=UPI0039A11D97